MIIQMSVRSLVKSAILIPNSIGIYKFDPYRLMTNYHNNCDKSDLKEFLYNNPYKFIDGRKKYKIYKDHKTEFYFIDWLPYSVIERHNHNHQTSFILIEGSLKERVYSPNGDIENTLFASNYSQLTGKEYHMIQSIELGAISLHVDIF